MISNRFFSKITMVNWAPLHAKEYLSSTFSLKDRFSKRRKKDFFVVNSEVSNPDLIRANEGSI